MTFDSARRFSWGDKWREAVERAFPTYARSVFRSVEIKISGRTVEASVCEADKNWTSQKCVLMLSRFSDGEESALMDALNAAPKLLESLAHHLEPKETLDLALRAGVRLLPGPGVKFSVKCGCGMRGMCAHAYAALHGIGKKVDRNPFLLFRIRGLDVGQIAEQCAQPAWESELPADSVVVPVFSDFFELVPCEGPESVPEVFEHEKSKIADVKKAMTYAVSANALFPEDFVAAYRNAMLSLFEERFERYPEKSVDLTESGVVRYAGENRWMFGNIPLEWALDALSVEGPVGISRADASFRLLNDARLTALEILNCGAVYPKLFTTNKKTAQIFWMPQRFVPEVREAISRLQKRLPAKFVRSEMEAPGKMTRNAAEILLVAILSLYMRRSNPERKFKDDRLYAFFGEATLDCSPRAAKDIGELLEWLSGYELPEAKYLPFVNGADAGFGKVDVDLDVVDVVSGEVFPFSKLWTQGFSSEKRGRVLLALQPLRGYLPGYDEYVSQKAHDNLHLSGERLIRFLNESVPLFRALCIGMELPSGIETLVRGVPRPQIVRSKEKARAKFCRLENLLQLNWTVAIGDKSMDGKRFLELYAESKDLLYDEGQYFYVSAEDVDRLKEGLRNRFKVPAIQVLQIALAGEFEGLSVEVAPDALAEIHRLRQENEKAVSVPPQIRAKLRPYQLRGFAWMLGNSRLGFGSIIADDMGLGKTLQVIALLQQMKNEGALEKRKALIVVPTGLLQNWKRELSKFAPELRVQIYHGSLRRLETGEADVFVTTYGVLRSDKEKLSGMDWQLAVIDEAQNIKNAGTSQSRAVRAVSAQVKIAMSGTPVENRLMEFWSIMDFCNRGFFGSAKSFREEFEKPIQERADKHRAELFRKVTAPFLLRRLKTDKSIIADLPEKLEQDDWAALSPEQEKLYRETFENAMEKLGNFDLENPEQTFERGAVVLRLILSLKQICNHPAQYLKDGNLDPALSGKMELFLNILESILDSDEKVLVFTQFTEMGEILQNVIRKQLKAQSLFYHGGVSVGARERVISEFENNPESKILILSLKAGGTGLNLTAASQVIHYDLWWNPAVESQATDRAYRIGQNRRVVVHRLITKDSFEEKINDIIQSKKKISDMTVATGESWITKLSDDELREVFTLGKS